MNHQITENGEFRQQEQSGMPLYLASTIGETIRHRAEALKDKPAIVSSDFAAMSYGELQSLIDQVRTHCRLGGLGRSARIAVAMPNVPQTALAIVAVSCSMVSVPINPNQTIREVEACFAAVRPDALLVMRGSDCPARQVAEQEGLAIVEAVPFNHDALGFSIEVARSETAVAIDEAGDPDPDAAAFILQTSGTSAEPKLVPFSHRNMLAVASRLQAWFDLTANDRCLSVSPPYYSHGLKVTILTSLVTGGAVAFPADPAKFDYWEWFGVLKPTWYSAGPTLHRFIFDQTKSMANARTGHSLRFITGGGAPLPPSVLNGLQNALGVPVAEHYGSSEAGLVASNELPPRPFKAGTVGRPWPGAVRIVGDDEDQVPMGKKGEVWVGGPSLISGYLGAADVNRESIVDGWFKTGDIGSIDEQGFLTLHGRKNDLINRGGEKISPVEIDEALAGHPAVAEAAAFAIPHARLGQDVAAAVVLRPGMTATAVDIRKYLQGHLASFKIPGRIIFGDHLPKGKTGKVLRRQLGASIAEAALPEIATPAEESGKDIDADSALIIQLKELWERLLQTSAVSLDDDFSDKGGDSLLAMEMLSELESLLGTKIPISILFEARTIRQLAESLSDIDAAQATSLVKLNPNGSQPPFFLFHGDYRGGFYAARLANFLGSDQPLFIIPPHGLGDEAIPGSIKEMAADRLPLILKAQATGPYRLCGFCNGAIVAFEVARMLLDAGEKVEIVGMIDYPTLSAHRLFRGFGLAMRYARPLLGSVADRAVSWMWHRCLWIESFLNLPLKRRLAVTWSNLKGLLCHDTGQISPITRTPYGSFPVAMRKALARHLPAPITAPVIYFSAEFGSLASRRLSPDVEVVKLGNHHDDTVRDPAHLADIAKRLLTRFETTE